MAEVMLEGYNFGGVYVAIQAVLALYAQGRWRFLGDKASAKIRY
jgi:actin-related protein